MNKRIRQMAILSLSLVWCLLHLATTGQLASAHIRAVGNASVTFVVDTTVDMPDILPGDGLCLTRAGSCSLRAAVQEANAHDGADIIVVRAGTYFLALAGADEDMAVTGDLDINSDVQIQGAGATSTVIDAGQLDRIFHVTGAFQVRISGLTLQNGMTGTGEDGGAIFNGTTANTVVIDCIIQNNIADQWGGGIANNENAKLDVQNTIIRNNRAGVLGGGLDNHNATATVINSRIYDNIAVTASGGGAYNDGTLRIENGHITNNRAALDGGGIFNFRSLRVERTTVDNNYAGTGDAGGILSWGDLEIRNVTLSGNRAGRDAGGIFNLGEMEAWHLTVYANQAIGVGGGLFQDGPVANLRNSIIAGNTGVNCTRWNTIASLGNNLEDSNSCQLTFAGDLPNTAPQLGPLQANGGVAPTHAPLAGSPAINSANAAECLVVDERQVPRPQGGACDIGAVEVSNNDVGMSKAVFPNPVLAASTLAYYLTISNMGTDTASNVVVTDTLPSGVTFVGVEAAGWTCDHFNGAVHCDKSPLAIGANEQITVTVLAPNEGGIITNTAAVTASLIEASSTNNVASITTTVIAIADLGIIVDNNPAPVQIGQPVSFTIDVNNYGPSTARELTVALNVPVGQLADIIAAGAGWSCLYQPYTLLCTRPSLAANTPAPPIVVTVTPLVGDTIIEALATVSANTNEGSPANNTARVVLGTSITPRADLAISLDDDRDPVGTGQSFTYLIRVENLGPHTANSVVVTLPLPANVQFGQWAGVGWSCSGAGGNVTCTRADLGVGVAPPLSIVVTAPTSVGLLSTTVQVRATTEDPALVNNSAAEATSVTAIADLALSIASMPDPVAIAANLTYSLAVTNLGNSTATNLVITATLPAAVTYVSASGSGWSCGLLGQVVTCSRATLAVGDAPVIVLVANVTDAAILGGQVTLAAQIGASSTDPNLNNNAATRSNTTGIADLSVAYGASYGPGGNPLTLSITVTNGGPNTAAPVTALVQLPDGVSFDRLEGPGWTCTAALRREALRVIPVLAQGERLLSVQAHRRFATAADGTLTCTLPSLPPGSSTLNLILLLTNPDGGLPITIGVGSPAVDPIADDNSGTYLTVAAYGMYLPLIDR